MPMGADILEGIEVKMFRLPEEYHWQASRWEALLTLEPLVVRDYGVFASLFGVRNGYGFTPLAPARDLPSDVSYGIKHWMEESGVDHLPSWVTWQELAAMDWEEEGSNLVGISMSAEEAAQQTGVVETHLDKSRPGQVVVVKQWKRRELVWPTWTTLFKVMETLAGHYGDERVHLVVWFDQDRS
jgi:hypothetical protein